MVWITVVYLLIGCQIGGRMFFWTTEGRTDVVAQVYCMTIVPLTWPLFLVLAMLPKTNTYYEAIFNWSVRDLNEFNK